MQVNLYNNNWALLGQATTTLETIHQLFHEKTQRGYPTIIHNTKTNQTWYVEEKESITQ